jgi:hypothetical protein
VENPSLRTDLETARVRELWNRTEHKSPMTTRAHKVGVRMKFSQQPAHVLKGITAGAEFTSRSSLRRVGNEIGGNESPADRSRLLFPLIAPSCVALAFFTAQ